MDAIVPRAPACDRLGNRRIQFLAGVEVREIGMDEWVKANETFKPVWLG